jgi:dimeric dUTPase (all-alpha-NTP-PPase superfamily)
MSLDKFFEHFGFYNLLDSGDIYRIKNGQVFDKKTINLDNFLGIKEYLYTRDLLKQKLNFSEIEKDSSLHKYLNSRYQTNLCNFLEEKSTGNLIILNCSPDGNYILSFQIRTMKETTKIENKYLTFTFSKVSELLGFNRDENTNKIDLISTYFGILKIK